MERKAFDMLKFIPILGATAVLALAGCTNDEPAPEEQASDLATASASASATVEENTIDLVCPDPIGTVQVTRDEGDDWSPAYVVGSDVVLDPVGYGQVTFTDSTTGQTTTQSPVTRADTDTAGAVECSYTDEVSEKNAAGEEVHGTVSGTVLVKQR